MFPSIVLPDNQATVQATSADKAQRKITTLNETQALKPSFLLWSFHVAQGKHSEDGQGSGGGHQNAGVWCSLWPGQAVSGGPVLCQDHHAADRRGQTGSCQHRLRRPRDAGKKPPVQLIFACLFICCRGGTSADSLPPFSPRARDKSTTVSALLSPRWF